MRARMPGPSASHPTAARTRRLKGYRHPVPGWYVSPQSAGSSRLLCKFRAAVDDGPGMPPEVACGNSCGAHLVVLLQTYVKYQKVQALIPNIEKQQ